MFNRQALAPGQWLYLILDTALPLGLDATLDLCVRAGVVGLWCKCADGRQGDPWLSSFRRAQTAIKHAGLRLQVVPYAVVYPEDAPDPSWWNLLAPLATGNHVVLDPDDMNAWSAAPAGTATQLLGQVPMTVRLLMSCWGNVGGVPSFPWSEWLARVSAVLPEQYVSAYGRAPDDVYNMPFLGGPGRGLETLTPAPSAVIPTFDFAAIPRMAALAQTGGFPSIGWWEAGRLTAEVAAALAHTPYAASAAQAPLPGAEVAQAVALLQDAEHRMEEATP